MTVPHQTLRKDGEPGETVVPGEVTLRALRWGAAATGVPSTQQATAVVVLLHGLGDGADIWRSVMRAWSDEARPVPVVAFDFPGHGESGRLPADRYRVDVLAATVLAALDHLGIARPVLIGHSLGARVALAMATGGRVRPRATVLIDMSPDGDVMVDEAVAAHIDSLIEGASSIDQLAALIEARLPLADPVATRTTVREMARVRGDGRCHLPLDPAIKALLGPANDCDTWTLLKSLPGPLGIIRGEYSSALRKDTARKMVGATRYAARLESIAMAGHAIPLEQPGSLAATLARLVGILSPDLARA